MPARPAQLEGEALRRAVRRNTGLLSAALALNSATLQLVAAAASLTFVLVTGLEALLGLGPAIFLATSGVTALPAGRLMDRLGRVPVLASGFAAGAVGGVVAALGVRAGSGAVLVLGYVLLGIAGGIALLSRTAAADMYPPERRARGIALVLFGAVFGAVLGPLVFGPLFAGRELEGDVLALAWLVAGGFMTVGLAIVLAVRPDPTVIARALAVRADVPGSVEASAAPLGRILRRPGVIPALVAALASFGVMVALMNLVSYVVVHEHGHAQSNVFLIIGAHVLGMFALVLVVGAVVDRIGRRPSLVGGLLVMALTAAALAAAESVAVTAFLLFALGIGWNLSFVAATATLADCAAVGERGRLLGFNDLCSSLVGASLVLAGGFVAQAFGPVALALGGAALALAPALWMLRPPPASGEPAPAAPRA